MHSLLGVRVSILVIQGPNRVHRAAVATYFQARQSTGQVPVEVLTCADVSGVMRGLAASQDHGVDFLVLELGELANNPRTYAPQALLDALEALDVPFVEVVDGAGEAMTFPDGNDCAPLASVVWAGKPGEGLQMGLAIAGHYLDGQRTKPGKEAMAVNDVDGGERIRSAKVEALSHEARNFSDDYELGGYAGI